jgi:hypothetical protein
MIWYIIGSIVLLIIILRAKKYFGLPVLKISIFTNGYDYGVKFQKLHPDTKPIEYVRLILHFISKAYYISDEENRLEILNFLNDVSEDVSSDYLKTGIVDYVPFEINSLNKIPKTSGVKEIKATFYFKSTTTRGITTKLPFKWYQNQFYLSVLALLFSSTGFLDAYHLELLQKSLKNLALSYNSPTYVKSARALFEVPNMAFLEAVIDKS